MDRKILFFSVNVLFVMASITLIGCGGGGGSGSDSAPAPSVQILPSAFNFGIVTSGNTAVPLEVKVKNNGSANLKVSDIILSDTVNYTLDLAGGTDPCSTSSPTIGAGDMCTAEVAFNPTFAGSFNASLQIKSDSINATVKSQMSGIAEPITSINVRINQVESDINCPAAKVTAYVSVIDQGGYPVAGLLGAAFTVFENGNPIVPPGNLTYFSSVSLAVPIPSISIAFVMDYSGSLTDNPEDVVDMEESVFDFINQLGVGDEAEIVKFASQLDVVQAYTSDKNLLANAIFASVNIGFETRLYDAVWQAIDDTASRTKDRRAVIVLSDGSDSDQFGNPLSVNTLSDVINHANNNGVPVFTIGIDIFDAAALAALQDMADFTGGHFYDATIADNIKNISTQLANLLFKNQYILEYISSAPGVGTILDLTIEVNFSATVMGNDIKVIKPCP